MTSHFEKKTIQKKINMGPSQRSLKKAYLKMRKHCQYNHTLKTINMHGLVEILNTFIMIINDY